MAGRQGGKAILAVVKMLARATREVRSFMISVGLFERMEVLLVSLVIGIKVGLFFPKAVRFKD